MPGVHTPPELLGAQQTGDIIGDVWSAGVLLYILTEGRPPFAGATEADILARVERGTFSCPEPGPTGGRNIASAIRSMLQYNRSTRATAFSAAEQLTSALERKTPAPEPS
ncbi:MULTISPECIES: protein kinase domain-containing protein [unclassified Streptomyces]|uniref:protein kinase domain-containing protein n=1 Tax=unclassified Streptomyces TaxID=2593676 RepID=UPI003870CA88